MRHHQIKVGQNEVTGVNCLSRNASRRFFRRVSVPLHSRENRQINDVLLKFKNDGWQVLVFDGDPSGRPNAHQTRLRIIVKALVACKGSAAIAREDCCLRTAS